MPSYGLRREHDKPSRANDAAVLASRLSKCCGGFAVCRPAHAHRFCSRVGSRYIMHCALHTLVLMGPPWYLGAAVANFVAARALGDHTKPYACDGVRHARKLKAARTDAAGRKCGEMPAAGDWCRGVHRELPGINAAAGQMAPGGKDRKCRDRGVSSQLLQEAKNARTHTSVREEKPRTPAPPSGRCLGHGPTDIDSR